MDGGGLSETEIQARLPVWDAIADLYLDTVIDARAIDAIARTLASSTFSLDELDAIHRYEVAPVVHGNLKTTAGEWAGWGHEWLRERVVPHVARSGRFSRWWADSRLGRWWMTADTRADWQKVVRSVVDKRAAAHRPRRPRRDPPLHATPAMTDVLSFAPPAADADTIENTVTTLYAIISGPAGQPRDWDRFRAMFIPGARMVPTNRAIHDGTGGHPPEVMDVETFIATSDPILRSMGFEERQIAMRVERFGCTAHAWSTYESRKSPDEPPFARGINSIQLYHDGTRWWVVTVFWDSERIDNPIPDAYLPG